MAYRHLLPKTRGHALFARSINFPVGTSDAKAIRLVPESACAALRHYGMNMVVFEWDTSSVCGPKRILTYIANGPEFFAKLWVRLVVYEVVCRSAMLSRMDRDILRIILDMAR